MTEKGKIIIKLNPLNKAIALILFGGQLVVYVWFLCFYMHYMVGPFPSLFSSPSLGDKTQGQFSPIWNAFMYSSFFIQHTLMATFLYKRSISSIFQSYPLYERFIYNTISSVSFIYPFTLVNLSYNPIFELNPYVVMVGSLLRNFFFIGSMIQLSMNLFAPYSLKQLLTKDTLVLERYGNKQAYGLKSTYFYGFCRHPMQLGIMMAIIFSDPNYTADRIQFIIVMVLWILIAIYYQEKRTQATFKDYEDYCKKVKYQIIPYIY